MPQDRRVNTESGGAWLAGPAHLGGGCLAPQLEHLSEKNTRSIPCLYSVLPWPAGAGTARMANTHTYHQVLNTLWKLPCRLFSPDWQHRHDDHRQFTHGETEDTEVCKRAQVRSRSRAVAVLRFEPRACAYVVVCNSSLQGNCRKRRGCHKSEQVGCWSGEGRADLACRMTGSGQSGRTSWSRGSLNRVAGAQESFCMCLGAGAWILIPVHVCAQSVPRVSALVWTWKQVSWTQCYQMPQGPS